MLRLQSRVRAATPRNARLAGVCTAVSVKADACLYLARVLHRLRPREQLGDGVEASSDRREVRRRLDEVRTEVARPSCRDALCDTGERGEGMGESCGRARAGRE